MGRSFIIIPLLFCQLALVSTAKAQILQFNDSIKNLYFELERQDNFEEAARLALDIGDYFKGEQNFEQARKYFEYAYNNSKTEKLYSLGGRAAYKMGMTLKDMADSGNYSIDQAQEYYDGALSWLKRADRRFMESSLRESYEHQLCLIEMGEMQYYRSENAEAIKSLDQALKFAQKHKNIDLAFRATKLLIQNCKENKSYSGELAYYQSVYDYYQDYFLQKDSINKQVEAIQDLETQKKKQLVALEEKEAVLEDKQRQLDQQLELAQLQKEKLEEQERAQMYLTFIVGAVLFLFLISIISYISIRRSKRKLEQKNRQILKQKQIIEKRQKELASEKAKTERLLLNILPKPVAEELKANGKVMPRPYDHVTVMFTDFKGFTSIVSKMPAPKMISELETCFSAFDQIIHKYNLEKIKTIGDGYMCAGGVPLANKTNPEDAVRAALEMIDFIKQRKLEKIARKEPFFEVRIGINTGPVIAGIVGEKKFAYDIWGDTVNLASRLESSGEEGRINISKNTHDCIRDKFFFTYRGRIDAKNKGEVDMYFVDGRVRYAQKRA